MCSITWQREKLLKVFGQIGLHQLGTFTVKSLVSLNACVRVVYFPPTAKVIERQDMAHRRRKRGGGGLPPPPQ